MVKIVNKVGSYDNLYFLNHIKYYYTELHSESFIVLK